MNELTRIFVAVQNECDDQSLRDFFTQWGIITRFMRPINERGERRGFCFIDYALAAQAADAVEKANGQVIPGYEDLKPLHVNYARPRVDKDWR